MADKITPGLKAKLKQEINLTKISGKERGLFLCIDNNDNYIPSKSCEGTSCRLSLGDPKKACNGMKVEGNFHTHPYISEAKKSLSTITEELPSDEMIGITISERYKRLHEIKRITGVNIDSPSYTDLLFGIKSKCKNETKGTVCTSSDFNYKVECWMAKDIDENLCRKANSEIERIKGSAASPLIENWIDNLFNREIIKLD